MTQLPPKPKSRANKVSLFRYMKLFQNDILSAQPARLYRAWMAEFRTPFFASYMCNDPELVKLVLKQRPDDFPKSNRIREGLNPLLGNSVFNTNGELWKKQRRIIDPAFQGGRLRETFPAIWQASWAMVERLRPLATGKAVEIEHEASHGAADVIFRTLFSIPIENQLATQVFSAFKAHQRAQPMLNLGAFLPLPNWFPRFHRRQTLETARLIRGLITQITTQRMREIRENRAPSDLATKIMTTADPESGTCFDTDEMVDQVAIFFLAGHETSASSLAWSLYLLAMFPDWQDKVATEAAQVLGGESTEFSVVSKLTTTRDVFRETLRLYPPVPMMVRESTKPETFRKRCVKAGSQIVLSPWHLHRHEQLWENPDQFDPSRFQTDNGRKCMKNAYIPFSSGQRVCPGAGFAMIEGTLMLAAAVRAYKFDLVAERPAIPVAHLTVRGKDGIWLKITPREPV